MCSHPPLPILKDLIPPFLAHLASAFSSPQPPPALCSLLAPILRQRLRLLAGSSSSNSWLKLLTWSASRGPELIDHLSVQDLSAHPSSGEIETGPLYLHGVRRSDHETLKACIEICDWNIFVIYSWESNDPDGSPDAWKVLDIHLKCLADEIEWHTTLAAAELAFFGHHSVESSTSPASQSSFGQHLDDYDDYWNSYDRSATQSPNQDTNKYQTGESFFNRPHEQDEEKRKHLLSNGSHVSGIDRSSRSSGCSTTTSTPPTVVPPSPNIYLNHSKLGDNKSDGILKITTNNGMNCDIAIKQHISTSIKSLYRLARGVGIDLEEFSEIVQTEVTLLTMMDVDDT